MKQINDIDSYSFKAWSQGLATPINDDILNTWTTKKHQINAEKNALFHRCFRKWQQGKVSPIHTGIFKKFQQLQFREYVFKSFGIGKSNNKYSVHHLIPKCYFHDLKFDVNDAIPLFKPVHVAAHKKYSNQDMLIDPVGIVIDVMEDMIFCSK